MSLISSRRLSPRRVSSFGGGRLFRALPALFLVVLLSACGTGSVTTSTGAVVPAATVEAQDAVADIVSEMKTAYLQAVTAHDARAATEDPAVHKIHREALLDVKAGLKATAHALATWKAASVGAAPAEVLRPLVASARSFLALAVELGVLSPERAAAIRAFLDNAFPSGGGR